MEEIPNTLEVRLAVESLENQRLIVIVNRGRNVSGSELGSYVYIWLGIGRIRD